MDYNYLLDFISSTGNGSGKCIYSDIAALSNKIY